MARTRREFTPEYKDEAVKLVVNPGRAVATVARELGINEASLGRWVTAFKAWQDPGEVTVTESERAKLQRLRKENADLKGGFKESSATHPSSTTTTREPLKATWATIALPNRPLRPASMPTVIPTINVVVA